MLKDVEGRSAIAQSSRRRRQSDCPVYDTLREQQKLSFVDKFIFYKCQTKTEN
ncbi:hypothetical protein [Nostoc sp.]|uniref:hypothetical protein n=1 Tax=Nostoc sp. TaxID=1180 RepID=UPI002FFA25EA